MPNDTTTATAERRYNVVSPQGVAGTVPASKLADAYARGYKPDTLEGFRRRQVRKIASGETGKAAGIGALSGATFGLSNLAAKYAAEDPEKYAEYLKALREENPVATTLGEVGGAVATSVLAPAMSPAGMVSRVGSAAERGVAAAITREGATGLGRRLAQTALSKGAGSAAEGAFYGAGQLVTEAALGDEELTAERLIGHMGMGALLGGAFTGAVGATGGLVKAGVGRAMGSLGRKIARAAAEEPGAKLENWMLELADESAVKATGARGVDIRRLGTDKKLRQVGQDLRRYKLRDGRKLLEMGDDADALLAKLRVAREEAGEDLGALRKSADDYLNEVAKSEVTGGIAASGGSGGGGGGGGKGGFRLDVGKYLDKVRKEVVAPLEESLVPSERAKAGGVLGQLKLLQDKWDEGHSFTFAELNKVRQGLAKDIYGEMPKGAGLPPLPSPHAAQLQRAERMLDEFITDSMGDVSKAAGKPDLAASYRAAKKLDESIIKATSMSEKATMQNVGNRWLSPTDYLTGIGAGVGGMMTGGLGGALAGAGVAGGHKVVRERGRSVVAGLAERAAALIAAERANLTVTKKISTSLDRFFKTTAPAVAVARKFQAPVSAQLMMQVRKSIGIGSEEREPTALPHEMREQRLNRKIRDFNRRLGTYEGIAGDPLRATDKLGRLTTGLAAAAPKTATHLQAKMAAAAQFLVARAPKPPLRTASLNPLLEKWEPTETELSKWSRYAAAVEDPMSVVDDLARGEISREGVEVLRTIYPRLYENVVEQTMEHVRKMGERLPYQQRLALGILFRAPTDASLRPESIQGAQAVYGEPSSEEMAGGGGGGMPRPTVGGLGKLNLSEPAMTRVDRIASR
jgi:hypothetical protein